MKNKKLIGFADLNESELIEVNGGSVDPVTIAAAAVWGAWYGAWYAVGQAYGNYQNQNP